MEHLESIYELSPLQQGMLFHSLLSPETGMYIIQMYHELQGDLNVAALRKSWARVLERHPVLRTAIFWEDLEKPVQVVFKDAELPWQEHDWRGLPADEQEGKLEGLLEAERKRGFDFTEEPLLRLHLIRLTEQRFRILCTTHHILLDGWSVSLLLQEVSEGYRALAAGRVPEYQERPPYIEYIAWLQEQDLDDAETFWRGMLQGYAGQPMIEGEQEQAHRFGQQHFKLSQATTAALQALSKQHKITMNTIALGAWALLLNLYSGEEDVLFGTTLSGRPAEMLGVDRMIGMFINTLPLRIQVTPEIDVVSYLQGIQERQTEIRSFEYTPLVKVQEWSGLRQGKPMFDSIVVVENFPEDHGDGSRWGDIGVEPLDVLSSTNFPLTVLVGPGRELVVQIKYDAGRIEDATVSRMLGHFQTVLESMSGNMEQKLVELELLTPAEEQQILVEWNDTAVDYGDAKCLFEPFEEQAERFPDRVALVFEGQTLTYGEVNRRANQVAHRLQSLGAGPEVPVGICMERTPEMIISLLGILKAGSAYVPLDPDYPSERLAFILEDSGVPVLVTQKKLVQTLPTASLEVLVIDEDPQLPLQSAENVFSGVTPTNMAYLMYTSGSTGKPKGVIIEHHAVDTRLNWMQRDYQMIADDRMLHKAPFSFDASVWEIFLTLSVGAALIIARPGGQMDTSYLVELIAKEQVTAAFFIPSMLQLFLEEKDLTSCTSLRHVMCGGEALPFELQERFFERMNAKLWNRYGPTESTINAVFWQCERESQRKIVPIGRPLHNTLVYVLDAHMRPVPVGVAGELHIGGPALARGYWQRPELTAERFVPNPFVSDPVARMYRSGDIVRWLPDGILEFVGRTDDQVKIRGQRMELGEIEAAVAAHPQVREAVVLVHGRTTEEKRLVAYAVLTEPNSLSARDLLAFVKEKIPLVMVPSAYVFLDAMPLTPSGKTDRKRLPEPDLAHGALETGVVPRDWVEAGLVKIWEKVLRINSVGIFDNFFDIGGHSMLAVMLGNAVSAQFGVQVPLAVLFQRPTIAEYAQYLRAGNTQSRSCLTLIQEGDGAQPPLFLVHPGGGGSMCYFELARELGAEVPVYGINSAGIDWEEEPLTSIQAMAGRYLQEIREVQPNGPYRLGGWSFGGTVAFEMTRLLEAAGETVDFLGLLDVRPLGHAYPDLQAERSALVEWAVLIGLEEAQFEGLTEAEAAELFVAEARARNFLPEDATIEGTMRIVRVTEANQHAARSYQYTGPVQADMFLYRASEVSPVIPTPLVDAGKWESRTAGSLQVIPIHADHHNLMERPQVIELAVQVKQTLASIHPLAVTR
ncbi:hypothetical protein CBW65_22915 [Tumebacillus avium]|uniref:Carrier domain-containing protein n=1 Tax=Tumebacillus avium TaxID=1903704 RepID=A0A1Y0IUB0_9BACL|nr:non-ribosomal peptide synthetase [Tumebacillus avium]ARU63539.1 hypothetical protein CBW65_22915 [Tumebacillus avium]